MQVHHIALKVQNLQKCRTFYEKLFQLKIQKEHFDEQKQLRSVWYQLDDIIFMLERTFFTETKPQESGWHMMALKITPSELEPWKNKLKEENIPLEKQTEYTLYFRDPEKNLIALSCYQN